MNVEEFAAQRREQFVSVDERLAPVVAENLEIRNWAPMVDAAAAIFAELFAEEAPDAYPDAVVADFRAEVERSLAKTSTSPSAQRTTTWLGTYTVNSATYHGNRARGGRRMRWITMRDEDVRATHAAANGQAVSVNGTFDVGGYRLRFPGEPVGPAEIWIECRCVVAGGRVRPMTARTAAAVEEDVDLPEAEEDVVEQDVLDEEDLVDDELAEIPIHGVAAPIGRPTGDGRQFSKLRNRDLPLPLAYQTMTGEGGHVNSVTVGRLDRIEYVDTPAGQVARYWGAIVTTKPYANEVIEGIVDGTVRGVSVDVDDVSNDPEHEAKKNAIVERIFGDEGGDATTLTDDEKAVLEMSIFDARIAGLTVVAIPAFQEAYIALGHEFMEDREGGELTDEEQQALAACGCALEEGEFEVDPKILIAAGTRAGEVISLDEERTTYGLVKVTDEQLAAIHEAYGSEPSFAPGTKDGPGWITHPRATARIRRYWVRGAGARKIRWGTGGDFNRCRRLLAKYVQNPEWLAGLCANMHKEALGIWPAQHKVDLSAVVASATEPVPMFNLVAAGGNVLDSKAFARPDLTEPIGLKIEGDRVFGYIATWGVCHIGIPGVCEMAPHSATNYAYFRTGVVATDAGEVAVGQITMSTGHASIKASARVAAEHYDNTGAVVADVASGEDRIGIWFSGLLRPGVTAEQRHALAAGGRLSGDWRRIGGNLELVAALAVNVPGFPIPRPALAASGDIVEAVTAMSIVEPEAVVASGGVVLDSEGIASIVRAGVQEFVREQERRELVDSTREARRAMRSQHLANLRERIGTE